MNKNSERKLQITNTLTHMLPVGPSSPPLHLTFIGPSYHPTHDTLWLSHASYTRHFMAISSTLLTTLYGLLSHPAYDT